MSPAYLRKADQPRSNVPLPDEEQRKIRLLLDDALKKVELLQSDIAELEKLASWYRMELAQLHESTGRYQRLMSPTRLSAFLAPMLRRLYPGEIRWSSPPDEEKSIRWSLAGVEKKMQYRRQQLAQLDEHIVRLRIAVAPHKRLPEDVLRYIFALSCADGSNTPLVLSQVCSAWRRLVFDMPLLYQERVLVLNRRRQQARLLRQFANSSRLRRWLQTIIGTLRIGT
jgi:hypothetical protein